MTIDKSVKVGVITSLIGSIIFLYLLEPILKILSNIFFYLSNKISSFFVDKLYTEIAVGKTDYSLTQMTILIVMITTSLTLVFLRKIKQKGPNIQKEKKEKTTILQGKISLILFIAFINIIGILQLVSSHIKVSSINTFDQRIRILRPYITETEKQMFVSRFSSMRTYDNYRNIMIDIEDIAKKNKINLPEQLYTYTY